MSLYVGFVGIDFGGESRANFDDAGENAADTGAVAAFVGFGTSGWDDRRTFSPPRGTAQAVLPPRHVQLVLKLKDERKLLKPQ